MGVVYKARQLGINRMVALKMILAGRLTSDADVARFGREARAAGRLSHPNIANIHEIGEIDGHHYFSMDYIEGRTLADVARSEDVTPQQAARYLEIVARAVGEAHAHGVLHRDLKPANVLLDRNDQPHVSDFGLAKTVEDEGLTSSGTALGTPAYMSPEQAAGLKHAIGPATDIYSLGAILYELLTGRPPFQGDSVVGVIMDVLYREPPPPRAINPRANRDLETICLKCLSKSPADRYASVEQLADDLRRFLDGRPPAAKRLGGFRRASLWLCGVPIVAALLGRRFVHSTSSQRRLQWTASAALLISSMLLAIYLIREKPLPSSIVLAGGSAGGKYGSLAEDLAAPLREETRLPVEVLSTDGSLANQHLLTTEGAHLGLLQADALLAGELVVAAPLYYEIFHLVIRKETQQQLGIESVSDLQGAHRPLSIAWGSPDSGSRDMAVRLLEKIGVEPDRLVDAQARFGALLEDTRLDLGVLVTSPDSDVLRQVLQSRQFRLLPIRNPDAVALRSPGLLPLWIQAAEYPSAEPADFPSEGISTLAVPAFLAVRNDASPKLVRAALTALYGDSGLMEKHRLISPAEALRWSALPWHPAATAFLQTDFQADVSVQPSGPE